MGGYRRPHRALRCVPTLARDRGWERVAQVMRAPNAVEDKTAYAWRDTGAMPGTTYRYGVAGVSGYGRSGPVLTSHAITVP